jgi:hypothetical protein
MREALRAALGDSRSDQPRPPYSAIVRRQQLHFATVSKFCAPIMKPPAAAHANRRGAVDRGHEFIGAAAVIEVTPVANVRHRSAPSHPC